MVFAAEGGRNYDPPFLEDYFPRLGDPTHLTSGTIDMTPPAAFGRQKRE